MGDPVVVSKVNWISSCEQFQILIFETIVKLIRNKLISVIAGGHICSDKESFFSSTTLRLFNYHSNSLKFHKFSRNWVEKIANFQKVASQSTQSGGIEMENQLKTG